MQKKIALIIIVLLVAFACGRFSVQKPAVHETTDIKQDINTSTNKDTHKHVTTVTIIKPDGTKQITSTTDEDSTTNKHTTKDATDDSSIVTTPAKTNTLNVSALAGVDLFRGMTPTYGISVTKQLIGPITIGAFGMTNSLVGVSIGLNF